MPSRFFIMEKILIVIPYLKKEAQGDELTLAVTGWRKFFKENYLIVIVGDWHPLVESGDDIMFIRCPRVKFPGKGNYWAHIDHVNKFLKVREAFPDSEGFIYTCDDIYATREFDIGDVKAPKVRVMDIIGSFHSPNAWVRDNYKTRRKLVKNGLPSMNWVCHLPVWYEWDKLLQIYEKYKCHKTSYVVEQLYFNTFHANDDYVVIETEPNDYQYKLWARGDKIDDFMAALGKKIWVSNSCKGWRPEMEDALRRYYGI